MKISIENIKTITKIKHFKLYSILTLSFLLILFGGAVFSYLSRNQHNSSIGRPNQSQGWGQRPGGAENFGGPPSITQKQRWNGPILNPPGNKITYYKGLWGANWFYPEEYTGLKFDSQKYKEWGVNIVMLQPGFEINKNGEVRYPPDFPTYEDIDARIGELATKFYKADVLLGLTLIVTYKEKFLSGRQDEMWAGEPQPFPKEIVEKPRYFDKYKRVVEDMAKIAEKYHIYMFSPVGEAEGIFGMNVAPSLVHEMAPLVRKHYTGKLYYKGDLHLGQGDRMNFKGYDVLGMVTSPIDYSTVSQEGIRKSFAADMDRVLGWAKRDGVPKVVISEWGYLGNNTMDTAEHIGLVLEQASDKLNGAFVTEPIPAVSRTKQGEQIIQVIKKWFKKI